MDLIFTTEGLKKSVKKVQKVLQKDNNEWKHSELVEKAAFWKY